MNFDNTIIYFFSGTGNSYRVAKWVEEKAEKTGSECKLLFTRKVKKVNENNKWERKVIGIIFPTHGFTMPWELLKFVCRLPRSKKTDAFCIATRASLKIGCVTIPGMSGNGTFVTALILSLKGYRVRGVMSVNMPSNWCLAHPIQSIKRQKEILKRSNKKIDNFSSKIFAGKKVWFTLNNLYEITDGILLSLISVGYMFIGRFFHAKLFLANSKCIACGICVNNCPFNAIKLRGKRSPKPFWTYRCESCMKCATLCPHYAIDLGQSWGVILYFIAVLPVSIYLFTYLSHFSPGIADLKGSWVGTLVDILFWYPAIFISYLIFHLLNRIPFINWIFTHTTMTHIKSWGRYKELDTDLLTFDKE